MAAESGGFKPGDFYIGVVELFAILLPGAILTYLVWSLDQQYLPANSHLQNLAPRVGTPTYLTFAVLSYTVGHFLAACGWVLMEPVFDAQRKGPFFPHLQELESRTRVAARKSLKLSEEDDLFHWASAYIDTHYPAAASKLEPIEADCKFFRNLIPALLLSLPIFHVHHHSSTGAIVESLGILCFFAYATTASFFYRRQRALRFCVGITSLPWLALLLAIPVMANIGIAVIQHQIQPRLLIDVGILVTILMAIARYLLLQSKRVTTTYEYLLTVLDPHAPAHETKVAFPRSVKPRVPIDIPDSTLTRSASRTP